MLKLWRVWATRANSACRLKYSAAEQNGTRCQKEIGQISCKYLKTNTPLLYPHKYPGCAVVHPSPIFHFTLHFPRCWWRAAPRSNFTHSLSWLWFCDNKFTSSREWQGKKGGLKNLKQRCANTLTSTYKRVLTDTQVANALGLLQSSFILKCQTSHSLWMLSPLGLNELYWSEKCFLSPSFQPQQDLKCLSA